MIFVAVHCNEEVLDLFTLSFNTQLKHNRVFVLPGLDCIHSKKTLNGFDTFMGQVDNPSNRSSKWPLHRCGFAPWLEGPELCLLRGNDDSDIGGSVGIQDNNQELRQQSGPLNKVDWHT